MRFDASYLCFECSDTLIQFILRIRCQIFACEAARGISLDSGRGIFFHELQHRNPTRLLSMREIVIRNEVVGGHDRGNFESLGA